MMIVKNLERIVVFKTLDSPSRNCQAFKYNPPSRTLYHPQYQVAGSCYQCEAQSSLDHDRCLSFLYGLTPLFLSTIIILCLQIVIGLGALCVQANSRHSHSHAQVEFTLVLLTRLPETLLLDRRGVNNEISNDYSIEIFVISNDHFIEICVYSPLLLSGPFLAQRGCECNVIYYVISHLFT